MTELLTTAGTIPFAAGVTTQSFSITVCRDVTFEADETFNVNYVVSNATIADGQGVGTIQNDDTSSTLSINDVSAAEGNLPGTTTHTFTVTRSASTGTSTVAFATTAGTATGGATGAGSTDYQSIVGGKL